MIARRPGFALLAAIWLLVAVSALALELSVVARQRRRAVANILESLRAEHAATSGLEHEKARLGGLLSHEQSGPSWNDSRSIVDPWGDVGSASPPDTIAVGDDTFFAVVAVDLGTLVNVNVVDESGLTRFLAASSIDPITADGLSQATMDWRDADDFRRLRGAERDDYKKAAAHELPRNGPFESIGELRFVRGMSPSTLQKIVPKLTVLGSGEVNVNRATEAVLLSVPGMTSLAARVIESVQRQHRRIESLRQLMDMLPLPARTAFDEQSAGLARLTFDTHELEVRSVGWVKGSPVRVTETAVVTRMGTTPVVTWRRRE